MNKVVANADEAIRDMQDGAVIMSGGFGLCGNPENLIKAIHRKGVKNLTIISNNCGTTDKGLGVLLQSRQVRKMIASAWAVSSPPPVPARRSRKARRAA